MERISFGGKISGLGLVGLVGVLFLPGCLPGQERSAVGPSKMVEERTLDSPRYSATAVGVKPATEPIAPRVRDGWDVEADAGGGSGAGAVGLSVAGEAKILHCVDGAFDLLMAGDAVGAVEILTEAQTVQFWAQSRRAPSVLYWLGQAHERLAERTAARAAYRKLLRLYADSVWSKRARKRLAALAAGSGGLED